VKIPLPMMELMLRSAGVPVSYVDLFKRFSEEGLSTFAWKPMDEADAAWSIVGPNTGLPRKGYWLRGEGPVSKMVVGIFLEGVDDAIYESIDFIAAGRAS
jgi:hypothetical protein